MTGTIVDKSRILSILNQLRLTPEEEVIAQKVIDGERLSFDQGLYLYKEGSFNFLSTLANFAKERASGDYVFFNINIHIEPTNYCVYNCKFCSYARKLGKGGGWDYSLKQIEQIASHYKDSPISEVHITGGVHPQHDVYYYADMLRSIKQILPDVHLKAFTAIELHYMFRKAGVSVEEGLQILKDAGLTALPGGGAEILDDQLSRQLHDKPGYQVWLDIHRKAHDLGITSNATMLYGHIEKYEHRLIHMDRIRTLQDETGGFSAFIPLKFRNKNNPMSHVPEVSVIEDMRNYAVARLLLDNVPHIKAYWVNIGKKNAQMSLAFGVDDLDGTIDDTTRIYSMAGAEEEHPRMTVSEMVELIRSAHRTPVERDTVYNIRKVYQ